MTSDTNLAQEYRELQRSAWECSTRAQSAAAELAQRYSAELFAASGGDDAMAKSRLAWSQYQRDLAEVTLEYWRDTGALRREAVALLESAEAEAVESAYTSYLEAVDQSVVDLAGGSTGKTVAPPKGSARAQRTSSSGRRTKPRRSSEAN